MKGLHVLEWIGNWPEWLQGLWFVYITFHDVIQWVIMGLIGLTAWDQRRKKRAEEKLVEHIHQELHDHMIEDAAFHADLGQRGMAEGE